MCKYQLGIQIELVLESLFLDSQPLSTYVTRIILFIVVLFHNYSCLSKRKYFPFFFKTDWKDEYASEECNICLISNIGRVSV